MSTAETFEGEYHENSDPEYLDFENFHAGTAEKLEAKLRATKPLEAKRGLARECEAKLVEIDAALEVARCTLIDRRAFRDLVTEITSQDLYEDNAEPEIGRFRFIGIEEIDYRVKSRGLIRGLIDRGTLVVAFGAANSSKTFLGLHIGISVASGLNCHGRKTCKQLVVYVASEGGGSITNRIAAYRKHYLKQEKDVAFFVLPQPINLLDPEGDVASLIAAIRVLEEKTGMSCGLVIIDTLSQSMSGGDENGPKDMTTAIESMNRIKRELGSTVMVVHHTGKTESAGARGHSSLRAAADTELEVSDMGGGYFQMKPTKQRDYALGDPLAYRLKVIEIGEDEDGDMQTTCVVVPVEPGVVPAKKKRGKLGARGKILTACVEELLKNGRGITLEDQSDTVQLGGKPAGQYVINVSDLRELFYKRIGDDPDMPDSKPDSLLKAFNRTRDSAQASGNIAVYGEYLWFT